MRYADVYVRVRTGPYRGAYRVYERYTTYDVSEDWVPEESEQSDSQPADCGVGTRPVLVAWRGQGPTNEGVSDRQAEEASEVEAIEVPPVLKDHEEWCSGDHGECNCGQDEAAPEQLPLL